MYIACFGDSLTSGNAGHSYIKYLSAATDYTIRNKGVNGDTTARMYGRLKRFVEEEHSNTEGKNIYIVCIGTNDLLLPYLTSVSPSWRSQMMPRVKAMKCLMNDSMFEKQYRRIIETVLLHNHAMIIVGLPHLELLGFPNDRFDERNKIVKRLADEYLVPYIDVVAIQNKLDSSRSPSYSWKHKNLLMVFEGITLSLIPGIKDCLSNARHLSFTIDGVHWNSKLAKAVADNIRAVCLG